MKKFFALAVCGLSLSGLAVSTLSSQVSAATTPPTTLACPACKAAGRPNTMTSIKTSVNTHAVKVDGRTMYCCAKCKMTAMTTKRR